MVTSPPDSTIHIITHEFYPKRGGISMFTEEMARELSAKGFDVEVWAPRLNGSREKTWSFRLWRMPLKGTHDITCQIRLAYQLIRRRRELRRATVYLTEPGPMLTMMLLQQFHAFRPKNLVLTFYGSEVLKFHRNRFLRFLTQRLIGYAQAISVISQFTEDLLLSHFPTAAPKIVRTSCALRTDFEVVDRPREPAPSAQKTVILTVARLHPRKGQIETMEALKSLSPADQKNIEYWIVGSANRPQFEENLRIHAATCDFDVKFLGEVADEQLYRIYDQAHIFSMTSIAYGKSVEGFGLVYLEAGARGLPVVAHEVGGVSEAVVANKTGFLISPGQKEKLTAAFKKLIDSPDLRLEMGQAGLSWATRYKWADSVQALFPKVNARPAVKN